jgi:GIY-YIG catalytic domain
VRAARDACLLTDPIRRHRGGGIYALRCPDDTLYVGKTENLHGRRTEHARAAWKARLRYEDSGDVPYPPLLAAFALHPPDRWLFEVLERGPSVGLDHAEAHWFDALRPELNTARLDVGKWWI